MSKKIIETKLDCRHPQSATEFLKAFQQAVIDGYRLHEGALISDCPKFVPYPFVVMYEEGAEVTQEPSPVKKPESTKVTINVTSEILDKLEEATKKKELQEIAVLMGVELGEDMKFPKQIKQHLLNLAGK